MVAFWKRYRTVITSREGIITFSTGLLLLASVILDWAGAGFWVHTSIALFAVAVGITGTDIAMDTADIVLMKDDALK